MGDVIDLKKRRLEDRYSRARRPLYKDHDPDYAERIERIKETLSRINLLLENKDAPKQ